MPSTVVITVKLEDTQAVAQQLYQLTGKPKEQAKALSGLFNELNSGRRSGAVDVQTADAAPVAATASIAITHANVTNNDTTTIANTVITAATSGNGTTSWTIGANATADAIALAACINANTTLSKQVVASIVVAGTVILTARQKGVVGNGLALATSDATAFTLTAFTGGTGGATDTAVSNSLGI